MCKKDRLILYGLVVVESVIWGFSFVGTKEALVSLSPMEVVAARWTAAAVFMVIFSALKIIKIDFKGKNLKPLMIIAVIHPCIYSTSEIFGIDMATTSEAAIIAALAPILVLIMSVIIYKEKIDILTKGAIAMAFAGVVCTMVFSDDFALGGKWLGYLLLLCSVLAGATFTLAVNKISHRFSPMEITFAMAVQGSIFFNGFLLFSGKGFRVYYVCLTDKSTGLAILFLSLGCTVICYMIFNTVISRLPAHVASALQINLITLTAVITGIVIKDDAWGWYTFVGLAAMLTGIVITNRPKKEQIRLEENVAESSEKG